MLSLVKAPAIIILLFYRKQCFGNAPDGSRALMQSLNHFQYFDSKHLTQIIQQKKINITRFIHVKTVCPLLHFFTNEN